VPKRINPSVAFARIYQEDGLAKQDWSLIVGRSNPERAVQTEAASEDKDEPLHREWLLSTLACNTRYSVTDRAEVQAEDGSFAVEPRTQYFTLLGVAHGSSRFHDVRSFATAVDPMHTARLAAQVQWHDLAPGAEQADDKKVLYLDGAMEWVSVFRIAPAQAFHTTLLRWRDAEPSPEQAACVVWTGPEPAKHNIPLNNVECPILTLVAALESEFHYRPREETIIHTPDALLEYDSRKSTRMRYYYLTLLNLAKYLPLASNSIPSQECQHFYKALLRGLHVLAGNPNSVYLKALNDDRAVHGKEPLRDLPLPRPALQNGEDEILAPLPPGIPKALPKPKAGTAARRRVAGAGSSRDGGAPPVLPPVDPPRGPAAGGGGGGSGDPPAAEEDEVIVPAPPPPAPVAERPSKRTKRGVEWLDALDGLKIKYDPYTHPATGKVFVNYMISCGDPDHADCVRTRGCGPANTKTYGSWEPLAFLHVWAFMEWDPRIKPKHRLQDPTQAEVDAYVLANRDRVVELERRLKGA